jgi:DnaJ-class molecular chaperone
MYEMYMIQEYPLKIQVTCKKCSDKGYINKNCSSCNGKGLHYKTLSIWKTRPRIKTIDKIDRDSKTNELRYWEDMSCFFEESSKYIHFNKKDADRECKNRNIEKYGLEFYKQYLNN